MYSEFHQSTLRYLTVSSCIQMNTIVHYGKRITIEITRGSLEAVLVSAFLNSLTKKPPLWSLHKYSVQYVINAKPHVKAMALEEIHNMYHLCLLSCSSMPSYKSKDEFQVLQDLKITALRTPSLSRVEPCNSAILYALCNVIAALQLAGYQKGFWN